MNPAKTEQVKKTINFFEKRCSHTKGKWEGMPFTLMPWQHQLVIDLFGTLKEVQNPVTGEIDLLRQYRFCYLEIPKKNGKSEFGAAVALKMLCADFPQEIGGEVYGAAVDREQASLIFNVAAQMVRQDAKLNARLKIIDSRKRIVDFQTGSFYQVLSSEVESKHGLNPSAVVIDELHGFKNDKLYRVLTSGTHYARAQQLVLILTTAGVYDKNSIWWRTREKARQIKEARDRGEEIAPNWLPILYINDPDTDHEDESVWIKSNPSLITEKNPNGIFTLEIIREDFREAQQDPVELIDFKRFRLNIPVSQINKWMPMEHWDLCGGEIDENALVGRKCCGGIDLASKLDLTAFVLLFLPEDENDQFIIIPKFYVPEDTILKRSKEDNVTYDIWANQGFITATPGNVCDYSYIKKDILEASKKYDLIEIGYDPWGATDVAVDLDNNHGVKMVEMRQGTKTLSEPAKNLLERVMKHEINHGDNPVLRWNADNMVMKIDVNENVQPAKDKATERIDGMVALIMANGRALFHKPKPKIKMPMAV